MRKTGYVSIFLGVVMILSAMLLYAYNQMENRQAGESAEAMLHEVQTLLLEENQITQTEEKISETVVEPEKSESESTTESFQAGYEYIGIIELPDLDLTLPVLADCNETLLKIAPCRDYGDLETGHLVIAAHNYQNHFGRLYQLEYGADSTRTDMQNVSHQYTVAEIMTILPTEVSLVWDSPYELVLYTCDYTNQNRIVVYCRENGL